MQIGLKSSPSLDLDLHIIVRGRCPCGAQYTLVGLSACRLVWRVTCAVLLFRKGRDMETVAHSDFKCLIRKCLMRVCPITPPELGDISMYKECPNANAVSSKILQKRHTSSLFVWKAIPITAWALNKGKWAYIVTHRVPFMLNACKEILKQRTMITLNELSSIYSEAIFCYFTPI